MKDCFIVLKSGILKSYYFTDEFLQKHKDIFDEFGKIWDEIYNSDCCVWGASNRHKNNEVLKIKLCNILDKCFDLNIEISNGYDNKRYKTKESYKKYILNYGKEV